MQAFARRALAVLAVLAGPLLAAGALHAQPVATRYPEGVVHGFLALRTLEGENLAGGDLIQTVRGNRITSRIVFHFPDGSLHDESAVFTQGRRFSLQSYRLVQKGPKFPQPLDVKVEGGQAVVRYTDDDGDQKVETDKVKVTADLANGMVPVLLKNVQTGTAKVKFPMLAATPKPRQVTLEVTPAGEETFSIAGTPRKAIHYVIKVDIHGIAGVLAPLVGKQPPDNHVWILAGDAPAFVKSEGPLYVGGPIWRIELASPTWPRAAASNGGN